MVWGLIRASRLATTNPDAVALASITRSTDLALWLEDELAAIEVRPVDLAIERGNLEGVVILPSGVKDLLDVVLRSGVVENLLAAVVLPNVGTVPGIVEALLDVVVVPEGL